MCACRCAVVCVYIKQVSIAILTVIVMKIGNQVSYEPNGV